MFSVERGKECCAFACGAGLVGNCLFVLVALLRCAAENMQAICDHGRLDVADEAVEPYDSLARRHCLGKAAVAIETRIARRIDDRTGQPFTPTWIEPLGNRIFVKQALDRIKRLRQMPGAGRRRHVADGDGADPALGGCGFAGIIDDERVDHRHRTEQCARPT